MGLGSVFLHTGLQQPKLHWENPVKDTPCYKKTTYVTDCMVLPKWGPEKREDFHFLVLQQKAFNAF